MFQDRILWRQIRQRSRQPEGQRDGWELVSWISKGKEYSDRLIFKWGSNLLGDNSSYGSITTATITSGELSSTRSSSVRAQLVAGKGPRGTEPHRGKNPTPQHSLLFLPLALTSSPLPCSLLVHPALPSLGPRGPLPGQRITRGSTPPLAGLQLFLKHPLVGFSKEVDSPQRARAGRRGAWSQRSASAKTTVKEGL